VLPETGLQSTHRQRNRSSNIIKLNKTQQELISRAKIHGGAASIVAGSGRGALGGRVSFGSRERAALRKLVELGLVRITDRDSDRDYKRGNCIHATSYRYEVC
jgi:hypothetical protein